MRPTTALPGKDQSAIGSPRDLLVRHNAVKYASCARQRLECFRGAAFFKVVDANRPRLAFAPGAEQRPAHGGRNSDECEPRTVPRPHRVAVPVDCRIEKLHRFIRWRVNRNKTMVPAVRYEREFLTVRRPAQIFSSPFVRDRRRNLLPQTGHRVNVAAAEKGYETARRSNCGRTALRQSARLRIPNVDSPDGLIR